jgi:serine/threonine protein kinase
VTDLVGKTIGPYTITQRIGRGGMADVYKALHNGLSVYRAMKVIRPELVTAADFRVRFQKEAQAVASLRHPSIVQMHDFGTHGDVYFMIMEFIEGSNLKQVLRSEGRIRPIRRAVDLASQIADALQYAHARGLIHRDIKPENIMITPSGTPILTDFGIAKLITGATQLTQTGASIGTPAYMPPEQALGTSEIGPATDVYALSIVLFEMLTGRVPFSADTPVAAVLKTLQDPLPMPQEWSPDIGDALQAALIKGTAKQVADRYDSIAAMRTALEAAISSDSLGSTARRTALIGQTLERSPRQAHSARFAAAAAIVTGVVGAGSMLYWAATDDTRSTSPSTNASEVVASSAPAVTNDPHADEVVADVAPPEQSDPIQSTALSGPQSLPNATENAEKTSNDSAAVNLAKRVADRPTSPVTATKQQQKAAIVAASDSSNVPTLAKGNDEAPAMEAKREQPQLQRIAAIETPKLQSTAPTGSLDQVRKGETTQGDLLRLFGGPNLTTYDEAGLETWVYERTMTQTDVKSSSQAAQGAARLGLFFKSVEAGASGAASRSSDAVTTTSSTRSLTVIVKFAPDRTVQDYTVSSTYF